jgi:hypothetical protein
MHVHRVGAASSLAGVRIETQVEFRGQRCARGSGPAGLGSLLGGPPERRAALRDYQRQVVFHRCVRVVRPSA